MNVFVAKELMAALMKAHEELQSVEKIAEKIDDKHEYVALMKKLLSAIGELEDGPILHIVVEHPSLNPFPGAGK